MRVYLSLASVVLVASLAIVLGFVALRRGRSPSGFAIEVLATALGLACGVTIVWVAAPAALPRLVVCFVSAVLATLVGVFALGAARLARGKQARPQSTSWWPAVGACALGLLVVQAVITGDAHSIDLGRSALLACGVFAIAGGTVATRSLGA